MSDSRVASAPSAVVAAASALVPAEMPVEAPVERPSTAKSGGAGIAVAAIVGVALLGAVVAVASGALGAASPLALPGLTKATATSAAGSSGIAALTPAQTPPSPSTGRAPGSVATPTTVSPPTPTAGRPATTPAPLPAGGDRLKPVEPTTTSLRPASPTSAAKPAAPTTGDATQAFTSEEIGIRVSGPSGWQVIENVGGPSEGQIAFLVSAAEQGQGLFARSGLIAFEVFPLPPGTEVSPDDFFLGFLDGLMLEFSDSVSGDGEVDNLGLEPQKNSRYAGAMTIFTISSSQGEWRYFWANHRIPDRDLSVQVYCGASVQNWDGVWPICQSLYSMIETTE